MNRRTFLSGFAAAGASMLLPGLFGEFALAQKQGIGRIVVDTRPLEARGAHWAAATIRPLLQQSLQRQLAGRIGRGPTLTVRVHSLLMAPFAGQDRFGGMPNDFLEGEAVFGQERVPILTSLPASVGGSGHLPGTDALRVRALVDAFAGWVARRV